MQFTAGPSNTIALDIPFVSGTSATVYEIANESTPFNITLQTNYEEKTTCTYDIIWEWDETSDTEKQYTKTSGATKEFTVSGSTTGASFTDVQLNNYNASDRTTLLYSGSITANGNNVIAEFLVSVIADVYPDGKITALDYVAIRKHIMGTESITSKTSKLAADCNSDNKISALDYIHIKNYIMNKGV